MADVNALYQDIQAKQAALNTQRSGLATSVTDRPAYEAGLRANVMGNSPELSSLRSSYASSVQDLFNYDKEAAARYANPESTTYIEDPYARAKLVSQGVSSRSQTNADMFKAYSTQKNILGSVIENALKLYDAKNKGDEITASQVEADLKNTIDMYKYETDRADQGFGVATTQPTEQDVENAAESVRNGLKKITDFSKSAQPAIEAEVNKNTSEEANAVKDEALDIVRQLKNSKLGPVTGFFQIRGAIPGTQAQETLNKINQLKGKLSLDQRKLLKGTGTISDIEQKMLENSVSALGRNLSETAFKAELDNIEKVLSGKGKQSTTTMSDDEIRKALGK